MDIRVCFRSYVHEKLKLPKGSAYLRVQTMLALRDLPELQDAIREGSLTISSIAKVQGFFDKAKKMREQASEVHATQDADKKDEAGKVDIETKRQLFEQILGKSTREAESVIANMGPELLGESPEKPRLVEKEVPLSHGFKKISLVADDELVAMLERLKEVTSHQSCHSSYLDLFKKVCAIALQKLDPMEKAKRAQDRKERKEARSAKDGSAQNSKEKEPANEKSQVVPVGSTAQKPSRYIPAAENHELWLKTGGVCQRLDSKTRKICGKRTRIQRQHVVAFAKGGANCEKTLFCQSCNLKAAIVDFGPVMKIYLNRV